MRYSIVSVVAAAASLPFVAAADSQSSPTAATISYGYDEYTGTDYIGYLTSNGVKPSAATYQVTVMENSAVSAAFDALYSADLDNVVIPESLQTAASTDVVAQIKIQEAGVTDVPEQYRSILSSVFNQEIALQTAAARPTDLALSAAVAGIVGGVAGLAIAL